MSVNVIWSYTNGGTAISDLINHGNIANGNTSTAKTIYLRHDGASEITNVGVYIRQYSGTYNGDATAASDFAEIIAWGDNSASNTFGGIHINWDAVGAFPAASWPLYNDKDPSNGFTHRTGVGDSEGNAVTIPTATGATTAGEIEAGASPNVRFQLRVQVPTAEDTTGTRQFDQVIRYSFTS